MRGAGLRSLGRHRRLGGIEEGGHDRVHSPDGERSFIGEAPLHQFARAGLGKTGARDSQPLGSGEPVALVPGCDLRRRCIPNSRRSCPVKLKYREENRNEYIAA